MANQTSEDIEAILTQYAIGRCIRELQVLGINSLKTIDPRPESLSGKRVAGATVEWPSLVISTTDCEIHVNLARTGRVVWLKSANRWTPADKRPSPTIRLLLDDGGAVDFSEPTKTKRITLSIGPLR